jgi:rubrerythrin
MLGRKEGTLSVQGIEGSLAVIRRAIHNEVAGQRFYDEAASVCIDLWAKEVFDALAREEEVHTRLLLLEYQALTSKSEWLDPETALASGADVDITQICFPDEDPADELFPSQQSAAQVIDRRTDDLEALAFGIQLEIKAIELYGRARQEQDPSARKAYAFLVQEETRHLNQLKEQWARLAGAPFER